MQSSSRSRPFKSGHCDSPSERRLWGNKLAGLGKPNRCKSDHGCQCWLNASCPRSSVRSERHRAKVWWPCANTRRCDSCRGRHFASVPQQPQDEFCKLVFVGASPTRGSIFRLEAEHPRGFQAKEDPFQPAILILSSSQRLVSTL